MATTQEILDQLNAYRATHRDAHGENIWQDVILKLDGYDETRTDALGGSDSTRFALADGTVIGFDAQAGSWVELS